jgi:uridine kinase
VNFLDLSSDAFDTEELLRVMDKLKHGEAVDLPKYDFKSYKSDALRRVYLWNFNIF